MEFAHIIVGIFFGIPIAFAYSYFLPYFTDRMKFLRQAALTASSLVAIAFSVEVISTVLLGIVGARTRLGISYSIAHIIVYFFAPGALATFIVSRKPDPSFQRRLLGGLAASALLLFLLMYNLKWGDTMYGIDGQGGPFS